jgi:hypothetical protein
LSSALERQQERRTGNHNMFFFFFLSPVHVLLKCAVVRRYACRIEQAAIVHLFEHHCMDPFGTPNKYQPDHLGNYPVLENTMLQVRLSCRGASSI